MSKAKFNFSQLWRGRDLEFKADMIAALCAGKVKKYKKMEPYEVANKLGKRHHCVFEEEPVAMGLTKAFEWAKKNKYDQVESDASDSDTMTDWASPNGTNESDISLKKTAAEKAKEIKELKLKKEM